MSEEQPKSSAAASKQPAKKSVRKSSRSKKADDELIPNAADASPTEADVSPAEAAASAAETGASAAGTAASPAETEASPAEVTAAADAAAETSPPPASEPSADARDQSSAPAAAKQEDAAAAAPDDAAAAEETAQAQQAQSETAAKYEQFVERTREIFAAGQGKGREAWEKAMEKARQQLSSAGEFSAEQGELFKQYMRREIEQTMVDMRSLGEQARDKLHPARLGAGALSSLAWLMHSAGQALTNLAEKAEEALEHESGDIVSVGTLTCKTCGYQTKVNDGDQAPICPTCGGKTFRKGY